MPGGHRPLLGGESGRPRKAESVIALAGDASCARPATRPLDSAKEPSGFGPELDKGNFFVYEYRLHSHHSTCPHVFLSKLSTDVLRK